jgi:predicted TIM-barrel fold metal-dependent hydrolase
MQVFDSIAHPTVNGSWFGKPSTNTFENLTKDYQANGLLGGCAVSLPSITLEELELFYKKCNEVTGCILFPVAAINFSETDLEEKIIAIKSIGYTAIKIHSRLSKIDLDNDFSKLAGIFKLCEKYGLIVFFCTYYHTTIDFTPLHSLRYYVVALLKQAPTVKLVLLHGGDVNVMDMAQLARFNNNILIDLSYTFIKFSGSSVEQDIVFLMNNLDKKICFGSDYPEYTVDVFKDKLIKLCEQVKDKEKIENFGFKNIMNFLGVAG